MTSAKQHASVDDAVAAGLLLRSQPKPADREAVREIATSTGFFSQAEIDVAVELIDDRLARGEQSDYCFIFADIASNGRTAGFACWGEIECTMGSFDLYWIAVHDEFRGRKVGSSLLKETERLIAQCGGRRIYAETSSRPQYEPTRVFYLRCGYRIEATLVDFYAPGDDKIVLVKAIS